MMAFSHSCFRLFIALVLTEPAQTPVPVPADAAEASGARTQSRVHFWEIYVPDGRTLEELRDEWALGLEPSHSREAKREPGRIWLTMLRPEKTRALSAQGFALWRADRSAFRPGEQPEILEAKLEGYPSGAAPGGGGATCAPQSGQFCQYQGAGHCTSSITDELDDLEADHPPIPGPGAYVQVVKVDDATIQSRPMYAVHIGDVNTDTEPQRRQLVVVAEQHAREWVTTEMAMRLIRRFADDFRDDLADTRALLTNQVVTFIPVANPDGYVYTHTTNRHWRANRDPCWIAPPCPHGGGAFHAACPAPVDPPVGTDLNRNAGFAWGQPGASDVCDGGENTQHHGGAPESEPETIVLHRLIADLPAYPGNYRTAALVNWHSYGNLALFTEGYSPGFAPCTTDTNGTPPDFAVFRAITGTELLPSWFLRDEATDEPYLADTTYRSIYPASGGLNSEVEYGTLPDGHANLFAIALELTYGAEGFDAECIPAAELDVLEDRQYAFLKYHLLANLSRIDDGSWATSHPDLGAYATPYVQRRLPGVIPGPPYESQVCVRLGVHEVVGAPAIAAPPGFIGNVQNDDYHQLWYHQWRWANVDDPWKIPNWLQVCSSIAGCEWIEIEGASGGATDLTTDSIFPVKNGWSFAGDVAGNSDYFYRFTGQGAGPWVMTRRSRDLSSVHEAKLCYSYRWNGGEARHVEVRVSKDDFASWRTVREYPRDHGVDGRSSSGGSDYFTEIIDVRDFDHEPDVKVRFVVDDADATVNTPAFDVFDCLIVGWRD